MKRLQDYILALYGVGALVLGWDWLSRDLPVGEDNDEVGSKVTHWAQAEPQEFGTFKDIEFDCMWDVDSRLSGSSDPQDLGQVEIRVLYIARDQHVDAAFPGAYYAAVLVNNRGRKTVSFCAYSPDEYDPHISLDDAKLEAWDGTSWELLKTGYSHCYCQAYLEGGQFIVGRKYIGGSVEAVRAADQLRLVLGDGLMSEPFDGQLILN